MAGLESFYGREDLADMDVVIIQGDPPLGRGSRLKRSRGEELVLPGHRLAVCAASEVLNAQILNWSAATTSSKRQKVNIEVPLGQLEVGRLLLRCMYQQQPDVSGTEQATLLQLLVLADKYAVPAAVSAVGRTFKGMPVEELQWEAVCGTYSLPATCADNAAFADVYTAAADALQQRLGDLELVFADKQGTKQQLLLDLPQAGLLQLLRDERTQVMSENTAAYAVLKRLTVHDVTSEQLQQLASVVRMSRCTHLYLTTVLLLHEDLVSAVGLKHLLYATACSAAGNSLISDTDATSTQKQYPGWFTSPRPASSMRQLVMNWQVPLRDIKQLVDKWLQEGDCPQLPSDAHTWQGTACYVLLEIVVAEDEDSEGSTAAGKSFSIGCFVGISGQSDELCKVNCRMLLLKAGSTQAEDAVAQNSIAKHFSTADYWGDSKLVFNGSVSTWREVEQQLRADDAVHADDCLHVRVVVRKMC